MQQAFPRQLGVWGEHLRTNFAGNAFILQPSQRFAVDGGVYWQPQPWSDTERLRWAERQRSSEVIVPGVDWRCWQIANFDLVPHQLGIIERIATLVLVTALDDDGVPINRTTLDGSEIFEGTIEHPNPLRGVLRVRWSLTSEDLSRNAVGTVFSGVLVENRPGVAWLPTWQDDLFGWNSRYSDNLQLVIPDSTRLRLWVELQATTPDNWSVAAKGRIGGYAQTRGGRDAAGNSARVRS